MLLIIFPLVVLVSISSDFPCSLWLLEPSQFYCPTLDSTSQCAHTKVPCLLFRQALLSHWGKARIRQSTTVSYHDLFWYLNFKMSGFLFFFWYSIIVLLTHIKLLVLCKQFSVELLPGRCSLLEFCENEYLTKWASACPLEIAIHLFKQFSQLVKLNLPCVVSPP